MGREIRRVPADWKHPQDPITKHFQPLHNRSYNEACSEWMEKCLKWERGEDPDRATAGSRWFWDWDGMPPDSEYYRPEWPEGTATHFQMYETVTEGTPVSPVFETLDQLEHWLVNDQKHSREAAHAFCQSGWAPSMIITGDGRFLSGIESCVEIRK